PACSIAFPTRRSSDPLPAAIEAPRTADRVNLLELRLPIFLWLLTAQIVPGNIPQPHWIVEIETGADLFQPFEKSVLLCRFLFKQDRKSTRLKSSHQII